MDRRKHERKDTFVPFEMHIVSAKKREKLVPRVSGNVIIVDFNNPFEFEGKSVVEWLKSLRGNIDSIIEHLSANSGLREIKFRRVNICGSGMKFLSARKCNPGDVIELKIMLPILPPVPLFIFGEVLRVVKNGKGWDTAVEFIATNDEIREEIAKFLSMIFEKM
jgi:hypothetical protein